MKNIYTFFLLLFAATALQAQIPTNDLVYRFDFDGNANEYGEAMFSTDAIEVSGGEGEVFKTGANTAAQGVNGATSGAWAFDGTQGYSRSHANYNSAVTNSFAISFWYKRGTAARLDDYMTVLHKGSYALDDFGLFIEKDSILYVTTTRTTSDIQIQYNRTDFRLDTIPGFSANQWYHIVVVKSDNTLSSYINNVQGTARTLSSQGFRPGGFCGEGPCPPIMYSINNTLYGANGPFTVGYRPAQNISKTSFTYQQYAPLTANLDGLRLYSAALSASDVNSLYTEFGPAGRNGSTLQARLQAYPSPASDRLELRSSRSLSGTVQVLNAAGQQVLHTAYSGTAHTLQVATLAPGIYTLHLQTAEGSQSLRFVKQ